MGEFADHLMRIFDAYVARYRQALDHDADEANYAAADFAAWMRAVASRIELQNTRIPAPGTSPELLEWASRIADERIAILQRKYVHGLTTEEIQRLDFCNHVVNTAYPSVSLADWHALDVLHQRYSK